jgi:hypothetical protein
MSDEFFRTRMGQRFYEATLPKLADQLERLNANIEALVEELRRRSPLDEQAAPSARARDSEKKGREPR